MRVGRKVFAQFAQLFTVKIPHYLFYGPIFAAFHQDHIKIYRTLEKGFLCIPRHDKLYS
jgi:hypothetical protein